MKRRKALSIDSLSRSSIAIPAHSPFRSTRPLPTCGYPTTTAGALGGVTRTERKDAPEDDYSTHYRLALAQEFKVLASLRHPNIISVLDYGFDERNGLFTGKMLRDFLVQVNDNDKGLYLGKAYNAIGKKLLAPSYFILRRAKEANF